MASEEHPLYGGAGGRQDSAPGAVRLALAAAGAVVLALLFAALASAVLPVGTVPSWDKLVFLRIGAHATLAGERWFTVVSLLGSPLPWVVAGASVLILAWRRRALLALEWTAGFGGGKLLETALKVEIHRPRPPGAGRFLHGASFGFPSGHVMGALLCYALLAHTLTRLTPSAHRHRVLIWLGVAGIVAAVAVSRLYLGVHYLSDVVAGVLAAGAWLLLCFTAFDAARIRWPFPRS